MSNQEITLDQNSDDGLYTQILRGRYVTSIDGSIITLDDGTELYIQGNAGCGGDPEVALAVGDDAGCCAVVASFADEGAPHVDDAVESGFPVEGFDGGEA